MLKCLFLNRNGNILARHLYIWQSIFTDSNQISYFGWLLPPFLSKYWHSISWTSLFKYYKRKDRTFAQKVGSYKIRVPGAENPAPWEEAELIIKHLSSQQQLWKYPPSYLSVHTREKLQSLENWRAKDLALAERKGSEGGSCTWLTRPPVLSRVVQHGGAQQTAPVFTVLVLVI
jgi:hypothetical protein